MKTIDEYLSEKAQSGEPVTIVGLDVQPAERGEDVTRDAARYRWLRDEGGNTFSWDEWKNLADLSPTEFEAAIDAKMPKTPNAI